MSKRKYPFDYEIEESYERSHLIAQPDETFISHPPATAAPFRKSYQKPRTRKHTKNTDRAKAHFASKLTSSVNLEEIDVVSGDEGTVDETLEANTAQTIATYDPVQQSPSSKPYVATQPSDQQPVRHSLNLDTATANDVSDDLFDQLCVLYHKDSDNQYMVMAAKDTLNILCQCQDTDLIQLQAKVESRDRRIARRDEKIAALEKRIDDLEQRKDALVFHNHDLKTTLKNQLYHAQYDTRIARAELQAAKRDLEESESGETERKLREENHTLDAGLNLANAHLYGPGGKFARKKK